MSHSFEVLRNHFKDKQMSVFLSPIGFHVAATDSERVHDFAGVCTCNPTIVHPSHIEKLPGYLLHIEEGE